MKACAVALGGCNPSLRFGARGFGFSGGAIATKAISGGTRGNEMIRAALLAATVAACSPVYAQGNCGPTEQVYSGLGDEYGETRLMTGLALDGSVMEIWLNDETGTWTAFATLPDGTSCGVMSGDMGQMWENFQPKKEGDL